MPDLLMLFHFVIACAICDLLDDLAMLIHQDIDQYINDETHTGTEKSSGITYDINIDIDHINLIIIL
jgi:hypothetical protein